MQTKTPLKQQSKRKINFTPATKRTVSWMGAVSQENSLRISSAIKELVETDQYEPITLLVSSAGGATGAALGFYDIIRRVFKPRLTTIGAGDVDSSGIIIYLSGSKRLLSPNTTMLFHLAGRTFEGGKRFSTAEMESLLKEDKLKDYQYAQVVAENSNGKLTPDEVLGMMVNNTVLTPTEAMHMGLADGIID